MTPHSNTLLAPLTASLPLTPVADAQQGRPGRTSFAEQERVAPEEACQDNLITD